MATAYQRTEPSSKFCEILLIGRRNSERQPIRPHEVTIFYKYKSGREGEFEAQGGTIFDSELSGRQRRLTIVTTTGHIFRIGRDPGGEYGFIGDSAEEFWGTKQRVDLQ